MAVKTSEAILRVSAKNLAKKDLRDVAADLNALEESQKRNAIASTLAARAAKDLDTEYENLAATAKELARRSGIARALQNDKKEIGDTQKRIRTLTSELERLNGIKASGEKVKGLGNQIRNVERSLGAANRSLEVQIGKFEQSSKAARALGISAERTAESIAQINRESARTDELINEAKRAVDGYNAAVKETREELRAQKQREREITEEIRRRQQVEELASANRRRRASEQLADDLRIERKRADAIAAFSRPPSGVQFGPAGDAASIRASVEASRERLRIAEKIALVEGKTPLGPAGNAAAVAAARESAIRDRLIGFLRRQRDGGEQLLKTDGSLAAATRRLTGALDAQGRSMDRTHRLGGLLADTGRKSLSVYQRLRGQILATAAAYVGLYQAVNLVRTAVTVDQDRRRIEIQLGIANKGDIERTKRDLTFLRNLADEMGLVFEDVAKNFANFKIAGQAVGASNNTIAKSFRDATQIVTGLGLSADDAEGVFRAFVQIMGKARVQAEELRGQLGDRLPGAVAAFAKSINLPLSQLDAYLKKGKGSVQDFLKFLRDYADTTKAGVEANSKTLFAQFNRLTNAYRDFLQQFAKAGVSSGLLEVVNKLIAKLQGGEGVKLARDLAAAFEYVGKVLLFVIDNFDTFVTLIKLYLGLQLAKAVVSLGVSFLIAGNNIFKAIKGVVAWTAAMNAARIAGTGLTLGMRGLLALLGPVGIALMAAGGALGYLSAKLNQATADTERLLSKMDDLQNMHGKQAVQGLRGLSDEIRKMGVEEKGLLEKRKNLLKAIGVGQIIAPPAAMAARLALKVVDDQLGIVRSKINATVKSVQATSKRLINEAARDSAAAKKDAEEQDNFAVVAEDTGDADAAAKAADAAAERRRDIADRSARELLDIEKSLLESRLNANITTQDQIDANLTESLAIVGVEIEKKRNELEGLKRDAERAGSAEGVASADKAIGLLPQLRAEEEAKLRIKATTDGIELAEQHINELIAQRDAQIDIINTKVELGLLSEVEGREQAIAKQLEYKDAIVAGVDALAARLTALKASDPDLAKMLHVDELIAKLETTKLKAADVVTTMELIGKHLGGQLAQGAASFFSTFIKGATGGIEGIEGIADAFGNAMNSFAEFLANFLVGIGEAILQAIFLQAIMNAITGGKGGYIQAAVGALTGHTGGVVTSGGIGSGNPVRKVSAAVFEGAQRFHGGGFPGLRQGEVPAILKTGEEVLSEDNPRNALNGGGASAGVIDLTVHNHMDSGQVVKTGLKSNGAKTELRNVIAADAPYYKKIFGIG